MQHNLKTGGQLLVECLQAQSVARAFGVPGESYLAVLDALHDVPEIEMIGNRNEGGAAYMAAAHGKLTGTSGICFVTRGPGATNASIGVHTAMQDSTPMILFVGQVGTDMKGREAFQEIDYKAYFGSVAKWVTEIDDVDRIPEIMARAFATALSGRPGPVVIALPEDMLTSMTTASAGPKVKVAEAAPSVSALDGIREILSKAKRPLVIVGGGGWNDAGRAAFKWFVEANHLPVACAFRFQDILDNYSPSYIGDAGLGKTPAMQKALNEADVIFGANIRFGENTTDGFELFEVPDMAATLIHSHASDGELNKIYTADLPIHAGPNELFAALSDTVVDTPWAENTQAARAAFLESIKVPLQPGGVDMGEIIRFLQDDLPEDVILTNGAGNFTIWHNKFFLYGDKARLIGPQSGAMGYGLPAAIAAKAEYPDRMVVCIAGDGDFQMNCQELGSAMQHGIAPIVLIVNNGTYGTIRMHQERTYPERVSFTDIKNPDFVALAKAYDFQAELITETAQFADAFARAKRSKTGAVLELVVSAESLTPRATLSDLRAQGLAKQEG
ncbi:MAG: thiamine pyrophosphate-binding protein [Paracoccaceae bacterium]